MECVYNYMYMYVYTLYKSRAYRAAEGGERACIVNSPHVDGEILHVTKNNTSSHAHEYECTNGKQIDAIEHGPLQTCTKITRTIKWCACHVFRNHTARTFIFSYLQDFAVYVRCMPSRHLRWLDKPLINNS